MAVLPDGVGEGGSGVSVMRRRILSVLVAITTVAVFSPVTFAAQGVGTPVIVVLSDGADAPGRTADALGRAHGFAPGHVYQHALRGFAATVPAGRLAALRADPRVAYVELDQVAHTTEQTVPTGINRIFAPGNAEIDIDRTDDWRVDVDVAVIDTGIDLDHPDLNVFRSTNCSGGGPFTQSCGSGGDDDNGHGSHVAGSIGALDNGTGVVGVAPGARLWAVKVLSSSGSGYLSWIIAGIDYVAANSGAIEVANMSLGCECPSSAMDSAIANAVSKGVVFAVAAGNSDKDTSTFHPAAHPDVISVSALADFNGLSGGGAAATCRTDQDDTLADFSNWGSAVEIAAPGVCILSTWPGGGYETISGTSMASPHVAGAAALLASRNNPANKTDTVTIRSTLIANGNSDWTDDSEDGSQEPLLDVRNTAVFDPALVAGSSGGGGGGNTGDSVHVGDLDRSTTSSGSNWRATVTVTIHDATDNPVSGATVSFTWSGGYSASGSCTTNPSGGCSATTPNIHKRNGSVTFAVTGVILSPLAYQPLDNHDPDGDSTGTSITVTKP